MATPECFGRSWDAIPACRTSIRWINVASQFLVAGAHTPALLANQILEPSPRGSELRLEAAPYLRRFAEFFSHDFLLEKLVLALLADDGCASDAEAVFRGFIERSEAGSHIGGLAEWVYGSQYEFSTARAREFLSFTGVVKREP